MQTDPLSTITQVSDNPPTYRIHEPAVTDTASPLHNALFDSASWSIVSGREVQTSIQLDSVRHYVSCAFNPDNLITILGLKAGHSLMTIEGPTETAKMVVRETIYASDNPVCIGLIQLIAAHPAGFEAAKQGIVNTVLIGAFLSHRIMQQLAPKFSVQFSMGTQINVEGGGVINAAFSDPYLLINAVDRLVDYPNLRTIDPVIAATVKELSEAA